MIALFILGIATAFLARHQPTFEASSVVYVSPNFPATFSTSQEQEYPYDSFIEEQVHSVTGFNVLMNALRRLKPGVWQYPGETVESAADRLQRILTAKRDGLSYQVKISLLGSDPTHLADVVNAVTDSYLDGTRSEEFYGRDKRLDALRQERQQVQEALTENLREQTQISQALGIAQISSGGADQIDLQVGKLRTDLSVAHEQRIQAEAKLSALENGAANEPNTALGAAADEIIASDPSLLALKASMSQKKAVLLDQLAGMTANHPLRKTTEDQLSEIEQALQQMQEQLRKRAAITLEQKLRTDLLRASTVESKLLSDLDSNTRQATHAAPSFQRALMLRGEITALQTRYEALDERTRNLELESKSPGSVHLFSSARVPESPLASAARFILPAMLPFALLIATGSVVLIDFLDRRIYTNTDVEQILGFSPIGSLFDDQDVALKIFDEGTLRMAGGIDQAARAAGVRTIVLTSINTGAGTTSVVENLGNALAKLSRKTLTIDSTGATPPMAYVMLSVEQSAHRVMSGVHVRREDVNVWPTTEIAQPCSPRLAPFTNLIDQSFKDSTVEYDLVLIDTAPILISAETEYLARFADVTILVVEAGKSTRSQLVRTARLLERLEIQGMAVVVNKIPYSRANRASREDVKAFESRMDKINLGWNPSWNREAVTAVHKDHDRTATENSTYA